MKYDLTLLAGLAAASLGLAQAPPTPPTPAQMAQHQVQRYTTVLSLNPTQEQQALSIFTDEATSESGLRASERTAHETMNDSIKTDNTSALEQAANTIGQVEGKKALLHATAEAKFYQILTSDQQAKYLALRKEHFGRHGGGPGEPPPPAE